MSEMGVISRKFVRASCAGLSQNPPSRNPESGIPGRTPVADEGHIINGTRKLILDLPIWVQYFNLSLAVITEKEPSLYKIAES
jgi:hypothetical protein